MKKYIVEFIGTFFLVLAVTVAANNPKIGEMAPVAIGLMLMVMIYAGGHVSGAHYNPAVTLGVWMRGKIDRTDVPFYILAQLAGAGLAAIMGSYLVFCNGNTIAMHANNDPFCALLAEFAGTFALVYVVLNTATTRSNAGNSYFGLAIGMTVTTCAYLFGGISGGAFNPAVWLGALFSGATAAGDSWIYLGGTILGAAAAATVFQTVYGRED
jgi:aquaporin Z